MICTCCCCCIWLIRHAIMARTGQHNHLGLPLCPSLALSLLHALLTHPKMPTRTTAKQKATNAKILKINIATFDEIIFNFIYLFFPAFLQFTFCQPPPLSPLHSSLLRLSLSRHSHAHTHSHRDIHTPAHSQVLQTRCALAFASSAFSSTSAFACVAALLLRLRLPLSFRTLH